MPHTLPQHLKRYVVKQNYNRYNAQDQAVWRYIMRQLKDFLSVHAHDVYLEGLEKTGLSPDAIPDIKVVDKKLRRFGWAALPVSGFIPPAAFMEFQARGFLPVASEMRTIEHIHYTPAPDIVHEAAGHAPIIVDPHFSAYLKRYADVAAKAIISHEDLALYEAIRELSDAKEDPSSKPKKLEQLNQHLVKVSQNMSFVSEAAVLGRMNWWTAEYGLIGDIQNPKIFGAGLLSSIGEARECLSDKVKKIPLTLDCINYTYDITEPQPQLFVTPSFQHLSDVLDELAATMAFKRGGAYGLDRAIEAATVNTVELNSGVQASGKVDSYLEEKQVPLYVRFAGPTQICFNNKELKGHDKKYHKHGFGTPVGLVKGQSLCLSEMTKEQLEYLGLARGKKLELEFQSGVLVSGTVKKLTFAKEKLLLISFADCTVTYKNQTLFQPDWGMFDMAVGATVVSVFGGPADRAAYGLTDDFKAKRIPRKKYSEREKKKFKMFQDIRALRKKKKLNTSEQKKLHLLIQSYKKQWPSIWLIGLELLEVCHFTKQPEAVIQDLRGFLQNLNLPTQQARSSLNDGIRLANQIL